MIRGMSVRGALAVNVITMIGIGPLITIPLVLAALHGSVALWGWVVGALIALCDGLVWAELGSAFPGSGGTYAFLREAFGRERWGRLFAFLFAWQIVFAAPLVLATGYIGFAKYAGYLWPPLASDWRLQGGVAALVALATVALLYRPIGRIAVTGIGLAIVSVGALLAVIFAGGAHFSPAQALAFDPKVPVGAMLAAGLGPALVITLYDYYGYGASATVGDEVVAPARTLPVATIASILIVAALYVLLQLAVLGAIPWTQLVPKTPGGAAPDIANYVGSAVVERGWGKGAASFVTLAILATAFASTFGNLLAYSRIPYAAARDGVFLRPFANLHATGRFPNVSLLVIGLLAIPVCWVDLTQVINALTTGLVIVQSLGQCAAVFALRKQGIRAPYRMWLFPIPNVVAICGWIYIFFSSGTAAIAFGIVSLAAGGLIYLWKARVDLRWPFAAKAAAFATIATLAAGLGAVPGSAAALSPPSDSAAVSAQANDPGPSMVEQHGFTTFEVDGKPFFPFGAAFFYERLPRERWQASLDALRDLGINTLDLYVIWNWHETADGSFDFDGHSSPRRDLRGLLKMARADGFKLIVRPGPVIRNEWHNGGYPAWLLERPEYGMPQHDLLEGRYPPTATLQNAHSDDAAAEWLRNATHLRYAQRWLKAALREFAPYRNEVLAIALDDDQGAYIDNQTWPAPHLHEYLLRLESFVHAAGWTKTPLFINTYQMKVTASSPVWAMGNWYQSDALEIGEHDRAQLEFSTALLQTRPHQPVMLSEFQAGWLLGPQQVWPRPAQPQNTALALTTALGMGMRGVVLFPAQDTLYPSGMEAPFANAFYAWDAAIGLDGTHSPRYEPTAEIGNFVRTFGPALAASAPHLDAQIAWMPSAFFEQTVTQDDINAVADETIEGLRDCRLQSLACGLVDLRYADDAALLRTKILLLPASTKPLVPDVIAKLRRFRTMGGVISIYSKPPDAQAFDDLLERSFVNRTVNFAPGAVFATAPRGAGMLGFLTLPNYGDKPLVLPRMQIHANVMTLVEMPKLVIPPRDVLLTPIVLDLRTIAPGLTKPLTLVASDCPFVYARAEAPRAETMSTTRACTATMRSGKVGRVLLSGQGDVTLSLAANNRLAIMRDGTFAVEHGSPAPTATSQPTPPPLARIPVRSDDAWLTAPATIAKPVARGRSEVRRADVYADGTDAVVLQNALVRLVIAPEAGARAFAFEDLETGWSVFTSVGGLHDVTAVEPPLSTTDRIAKYTHDFPAGTFNRRYRVEVLSSGNAASVRFSYDAPDVVPHGAHFERTVTLQPDARYFALDERTTFPDLPAGSPQRAVSVSSFVLDGEGGAQPAIDGDFKMGDSIALWSESSKRFAAIAWRHGDVESGEVGRQGTAATLAPVLANGRTAHLLFQEGTAPSQSAAADQRRALEAAAQGSPLPPANSKP
jgi:amino acid transporter